MVKGMSRRRRQLFAAVSVLGVSLGMADATLASTQKENATTQTSHKVQTSVKMGSQATQHSEKSIQWGDQNSVKYQHTVKGEGAPQ
jgi:hypothetical protein